MNRKERRAATGKSKRVSSTKIGAGSLNNFAVWRKGKFSGNYQKSHKSAITRAKVV